MRWGHQCALCFLSSKPESIFNNFNKLHQMRSLCFIYDILPELKFFLFVFFFSWFISLIVCSGVFFFSNFIMYSLHCHWQCRQQMLCLCSSQALRCQCICMFSSILWALWQSVRCGMFTPHFWWVSQIPLTKYVLTYVIQLLLGDTQPLLMHLIFMYVYMCVWRYKL